MQAQRLARALGQALAVGVVRAEAADVDVPQVARRLAVGDPLRDELSRTPGVGDASRIEASADEVIAQLRRLTQDEVAIGREALRPVEQHLDLRRFQAGRAVDGVGHQDLELVPVLAQQLELEGAGNRVHRPGLGLRFEATHEQAADFLLVVDEAVGVAHHGQHGVHALDLVRNDVEVLGRVQRHRHPRQRAELPRPLAGAVHQGFAVHVALGGAHAHGTRPARALSGDDTRDLHAFHHVHPAVTRALGQRHAQVRRVGLAVTRDPDGALQIIGAHHGVELASLLGRDEFHLHAETARQGGLLAQHLHALRRTRHVHAAAGLPARGQAGLLLQHRVQLDAVLAHARHVAVGPHVPDQPRRVPSGAAGELALFQQQHIGDAELGEVVGRGAASDAAANDDDLGVGGEGHGAQTEVSVEDLYSRHDGRTGR